MFALKKVLNSLNCDNMDANQFDSKIDSSSRANYLFNTTIAGIEKADLCLLIGNLSWFTTIDCLRTGVVAASRFSHVSDPSTRSRSVQCILSDSVAGKATEHRSVAG